MAEHSLVASKENEFRAMAAKYGLDRYLGTEKLAFAEALVKTWAEDIAKDDPLTASTKWLDTKSEIEDIMASVALESNSREQMYLLGAVATGQVSFDEVRAAYADGFNTLMKQYAHVFAHLSTIETTNIERNRDRFLSTMPLYGTIQEKQNFTAAATQSLRQLEQTLLSLHASQINEQARIVLGEKETTRSMLLSQAEAGLKGGTLSPSSYQQVQNLIGRKNSLFDGQVASLSAYGNDAPALYKEMDRVLSKAGVVLSTEQEAAFSLAGSYMTTPEMNGLRQALGRTGMTGDGIHAVSRENRILQTVPEVVGMSVPNGNGVNPAWVGIPNSLMQPSSPTIVANPNANHMKFMNPTDVHRADSLQSRFSAYHNQKSRSNEGAKIPITTMRASPAALAKDNGQYSGPPRLSGSRLGEAAANSLVNPWVQGVAVLGGAWVVKNYLTARESTRRTLKAVKQGSRVRPTAATPGIEFPSV